MEEVRISDQLEILKKKIEETQVECLRLMAQSEEARRHGKNLKSSTDKAANAIEMVIRDIRAMSKISKHEQAHTAETVTTLLLMPVDELMPYVELFKAIASGTGTLLVQIDERMKTLTSLRQNAKEALEGTETLARFIVQVRDSAEDYGTKMAAHVFDRTDVVE